MKIQHSRHYAVEVRKLAATTHKGDRMTAGSSRLGCHRVTIPYDFALDFGQNCDAAFLAWLGKCGVPIPVTHAACVDTGKGRVYTMLGGAA